MATQKKTPTPGVVEQLRLGASNPAALVTGLLLGGGIPVIVYGVVHHELPQFVDRFASLSTLAQLHAAALVVFVAGGLVFSARSVYEWGAQAFGSRLLAFGFAACIEGAMVLSTQQWVVMLCLGYLVAINAAHKGAHMAKQDRPAQARAKRKRAKAKEGVSKRAKLSEAA